MLVKNSEDATIVFLIPLKDHSLDEFNKDNVLFSPMKNVNKLTVLPVRKLMDIMTITS